MKRLIIIAILLTLSAGCSRPDREQEVNEDKFLGIIDQNQFKPRAFRKQIFDHSPGGDSSYDQGFQDGCSSTTGAIGAGLYRLNPLKIDGWRLAKDPWYLRGFQDAANYCTYTIDWDPH